MGGQFLICLLDQAKARRIRLRPFGQPYIRVNTLSLRTEEQDVGEPNTQHVGTKHTYQTSFDLKVFYRTQFIGTYERELTYSPKWYMKYYIGLYPLLSFYPYRFKYQKDILENIFETPLTIFW